MADLLLHSLDSRTVFKAEYERVWSRTEQLFSQLLTAEGLFQRPISLRNPLVFYLGHLPGFDYIHVALRVCKQTSINPKFDAMFERGIDPDVDDPSQCHSHSELPALWPPMAEMLAYIAQVKTEVLQCFDQVMSLQTSDKNAEKGRVYHLAWEHAMMHQETFFYMYHQLEKKYKRMPPSVPAPVLASASAAKTLRHIAAGRVRLGATEEEIEFGWDNEFPSHFVEVPAFGMDSTSVTIGEFLDFVRSGEYDKSEHWRPEDYAWKEKSQMKFPVFWKKDATSGIFEVELVFGDLVPIESVLQWPVMVSFAEAQAFAHWKKRSLPTEAQWMRAAYTSPTNDNDGRRYPWGDQPPSAELANVDWKNFGPTPINSHPGGASAWGVEDLIGDAWEWTCTPFGPYPGFKAMENYPGYSADFFDGKHFVMKGGSWATDRKLIRRSFRNWYQDRYPYMYAKFRLVTNKEQ